MQTLEPLPSSAPSSPPKKSFRRRLLRVLFIGTLVLIVLIASLSGLGAWFYTRTLPQTTGMLTVAGLTRPAVVARDQWGVPHITAQNLHDLMFAQGYTTAQDRMFAMELNLRVAQGRLSEVLGRGPKDSLIQTDLFLRTLGVYQAARLNASRLDAQTRAELQAYVDGVNAFLKTHQNNLPIEFTILGFTPEPWTIVDTLAYGRFLALALDYTWYYKYTRALILAKAGPDVASALFPAYPSTNPTLVNASGQVNMQPFTSSLPSSNAATLHTAQNVDFSHLPTSFLTGASTLHDLLGSVSEGLGSNNWVVDGSKTTTGKPLLANDPHLGIRMPSFWYEVALHAPGFNVIGFSFPGVPGIVIGHNDHIAWGITNVGADDADLYLETLDPIHHPGQYLYDGKWLPLLKREETIHIRGESQPISVTITSTMHGPLLNSVLNDLKSYTPISLKWTALQPEYDFSGFFALNFATNWQQFSSAVSHISIGQNFLYADTDGNIGYRMSGLLPVRSADNALLPVDGSTSAHEWHGYVPQEKLPWLFNPPTHMIATANNRIVPDDYPVYISAHWDMGYRVKRISDLLNSKQRLSIADYRQMQADVYSPPAAQLTPFFIAAGQAASGDAQVAARLLAGWNFNVTSDSSAAAIFEVTTGNLLRELFEPVLGKAVYQTYIENILESSVYLALNNQLAHPQAAFFHSNTDTQALAARDTAIIRALQDTMQQLRTQLGSDPSQWQWGKLHQVSFNHPLASIFPLNLIFGVAPLERAGDSATINVGGSGGSALDPPDYRQQVVSSLREIIDMGNLDNSLWVITTGESGQPFSAHYTDLMALWQQNQYQSMSFSHQAESAATQEVLTLQPA